MTSANRKRIIRKITALVVLTGVFLFPVLNAFVGGAAASQGGVLDTTWPAWRGFTANTTLVAPDGKIWVGDAGGTVAFNTTGSVLFSHWEGWTPWSFAVQETASGTFILVGTNGVMFRYSQAGTKDTTFGGGQTGTHNAILVNGTGTSQRIFAAAGNDFKRYSANGAIEATVSIGSSVNALAAQSVGATDYILVGGAFGLKRYTTGSVIDSAFTANPGATVRAIKVQSDGKILVAGTFGLKRYNADGTVDGSFPTITTSIISLALQADGKILAGTSTGLLRYSSSGIPETVFNTNAAANGVFESKSISLEASGKIIVVGTTNANPKGFIRRYSWENVAPGTPLTPTAVASDRSATVNVAAGSGTTPTGYTVYVKGDTSKFCLVTGASGNCTITGLTNGSSYSFYAVARNIDANSANSPDSNSVTPADTVGPVIVSATLNSAGTTLTLTYDEALGAIAAGINAFTVSAGGNNFVVNSVTVSGSTVELGIASVIGQGLSVTVSYTAPTSSTSATNSAIQDVFGNDAISISARVVTNGSTIDTTPPAYVSSVVDSTGTVLTLTYDEAIYGTTAPTTSFAVTVNTVSVTVSTVTVNGLTIRLGLASPVGVGQAVTVAYSAPTFNSSNTNIAVQDAIGNDSTSLTSRAITTNSSTVDLTGPALSTAVVNNLGTVLTLTYNEPLSSTTAPASRFTVTVGGVSRDVSSAVVSGSTVQLTLASTVGKDQAVTVAYLAPPVDGTTSNSAIQDTVGNDALTLTAQSASNSSTIDLTSPVISTSVLAANGITLTLSYNETLNATTAPTTAYTVLVDGLSRTVSNAVVSGSTVVITLTPPVERAQVVTISYSAPTTDGASTNNVIQDTVGNDAVSFTARSVTNSSSVDTTAPVLSSAVLDVNGTTLTLTYNEPLNATTAPTSAFEVLVDANLQTVSNAVVSGSTVILTLSPAVLGSSAATVAYNAPSASNLTTNFAIQDSVGNDAATLTATAVTNNSAVGPPRLVSAQVLSNGYQVTLTWSEQLGSNSYSTGSMFTFLVNGSPVSTGGMGYSSPGSSFTINVSPTITSNQTVTVSYLAPVNNAATTNSAVQDATGSDALSIENAAVINSSTVPGDVTAPTLLSASLNAAGTVLSLAYNETLNAITAPGSAYTVLVNGETFTVSSVAISTSVVQLTLGSSVQAGKTVTVSYAAPTPNSYASNAAIQDSAGNDASLLSAQSVTNNSTAGPDIAPPTLATVSASGTTVTLTFNESLTSTQTPPRSAFTVFVGETPVVPTAISISGSSVSLTLPSSVPEGTEVRVSYAAPAASSANSNAAIQDVIGNDALSFSGTNTPTSSIWNWVETFDPATMSTVSSQCPGGGSINRSKRTALPNGVTYTVGVTGSYLCIHDATESLSARGGAAGMFVATGLVTEPGLKITTSNDGCLADAICNGRGRMSLTFSQPVVNPVFSFAGWGGAASGVSWSEMRILTPGVTMSKLSGTNILVSTDGTYVEDNGQSSSTRCNSSTTGSSAVCGSLQLNGTVSTVEFEVFQQTFGGTGNEDTWNVTASMAEDFGLVPTTYESSGVASHGVGSLRLGATVEADQASALYASTNADAVPRWTSLANNPKKDDGVAAWISSPTIIFVPGATYSTTVALSGVTRSANLCAWIDFNRDENFAYSERTCAPDPGSETNSATSAELTWTVPADVGSGITYARVRLSYDVLTVATGKVGTGEVEDYSLVLPSNNLPAAVNDASVNGQDVNQTISPLTNDQFETDFPANNSTLKLCGSGQTPNTCNVTVLVVDGQGTYTVNSNGTVTFDPLPNFTGTATPVTYQISDTQATPKTASATITPTVVPRPAATADTTSGLLNISQSINPLANDSAGSASVPLNASTVRLCGTGESTPGCTATSVSVTGGVYSVNQTTGIISFIPTTNYVGTPVAVTYQVKDSLNQVASSTYTPTIIATPTATNDTSSGVWNVNQTISPFSNDTIASGHPLGSLALCGNSPVETPNNCSQPTLTTADGTYTVNANGTVTFDPLPTFTGTVTQPVTYQAKDDLNQYVNALITPSVTPPPAPTAVADTSSNQVNVTQTKNVLTNDTTTDPLITLDATSVRLCGTGQVKPNCMETSVAVAGGTYSVDTSTGVVSFTPTTNWTGTATPVTYQVTDSTNQKVSSTYTPTVIAAVNDTSSGAWNVNQTISPFSNDVSVSGHPFGSLKLCGTNETPNSCTATTLVVDGQGTYTVNANGTVTFDPLPTFTGTATAVAYQAVDDLGQYVNATITPSVTPPPAPAAIEDKSNDFLNVVQTKNPLANDSTSDPLITLSASSVRLCGTNQVKPNCTETSIAVTGGTYSVNTTTGIISFTPDNNWSGTAPAVTYQVTDSTNQTVSTTYAATVFPKPTASDDTSTGAYDTNQTISPFGNDSFAGSAPVVLSTLKLCLTTDALSACTQTSLTIDGEGTYTVNANGTVTFDPLPTFKGVATPVKYRAADTLGQYVDATITPEVAAPTAPVATAQTKSVLRGGTATFTAITNTSGLATGTQLQTSGADATCLYATGTTTCDPDNIISITGEGTYTLNPATGVVTFVADVNATAGAKTVITYRVTDITGQTATSTLTPVVPPAPVAAVDTSIGNYDTNQTLNILLNDTPGDASAPLVPSTVKLCGTGQTPNNCNATSLVVLNQGTYTLNSDGSVTFDPLPTFTGTATAITYQVVDSLGQITNSTITVTVRTPPDAVNDLSSGDYDTNQTIDPLANDIAGSGAIDPTTVKLCSSGQVAPNCTATTLTVAGEGTYTVDPVTGVVTFDPLPTFTGPATAITYQISDSLGQTDSATIRATVGPPPLPVAVNDALTGNWDTNQTYTPTSNDTVGSSFPLIATTVKLCATGQTIPGCNATTLTVANEGTYTVNANGTVTFDPLPTFKGTVTQPVTYQATDSLGRTDDATITPTVGVPPVPVAVNDISSGAWDTNQTISPLSNDRAGDSKIPLVASTVKLCDVAPTAQTPPNCTLTSLTIDSEGTYTVNADGTVTFDPVSTLVTTVATPARYQVTDTTGQVVNATITPTVSPPPAPNATPETKEVIAGGTVAFTKITGTSGLATGTELKTSGTGVTCLYMPTTTTCDPDNIVSIDGEGTFTLDPSTGVVTYVSLASATPGTKTSVRYRVTDVIGQTDTDTLTPVVLPKPTALPDSSMGVMGAKQNLWPLSNDAPGTAANPLVKTSIKMCGSGETAPACTKTSVTVAGEGAYTVNADGTVSFEPVPLFVGDATPMPYVVIDSLGQKANSTLNPKVVPPPAPVTELDTGTAVQGSTVVLSPWLNDSPGIVPAGVSGTVALVPSSIRLCGPTDAAPTCTLTTLTTDDGTYSVDTTTGKVTFVHRTGFLGTVTQPVTYQIANDWTGLSGIGIATNILIPTITAPLPPPPAPSTTLPSEPKASNDAITGPWDTNQIYSPLKNDSFIASAAEISSIKLCAPGETPNICSQTVLTVVGEGTYTVNPDGTVTFDPVPAFYGVATPITYQATDKIGRFVSATITPTVVAPPDIAKVFNQSTASKPGVPKWLVPTLNGIPSTGATFVKPSLRIWDPQSNVWTRSVKTNDGKWEIVKGKVMFTSNMDFRGETTLPYSVRDSKGVVLKALLIVIVDDDPVLPKTGASPIALLFIAFSLIALGVVVRRRSLKILI
jgi:uncharacterized repeat protein (TIGR02059 family)